MKTAKKYVAPEADIVKIGMTDMCCTSLSSDSAKSGYNVMSKDIPEWVFEEEEQ